MVVSVKKSHSLFTQMRFLAAPLRRIDPFRVEKLGYLHIEADPDNVNRVCMVSTDGARLHYVTAITMGLPAGMGLGDWKMVKETLNYIQFEKIEGVSFIDWRKPFNKVMKDAAYQKEATFSCLSSDLQAPDLNQAYLKLILTIKRPLQLQYLAALKGFEWDVKTMPTQGTAVLFDAGHEKALVMPMNID